MPIPLIEHMEGCTPLSPCVSCEAAAFLKGKLSAEDLNKLITILRKKPTHPTIALDAPIMELGLSSRTQNCLKNDNCHTVGDVVKLTERELLRIPNLGRGSLKELKEALASRGRALGSTSD